MRRITIILFCIQISMLGRAQDPFADSLRKIIRSTEIDSSRAIATMKLSAHYFKMQNNDSAIVLGHKSLNLARQKKLIDIEIRSLVNLATIYFQTKPDTALALAKLGMKAAVKSNSKSGELQVLGLLPIIYISKKMDSALIYANRGVLLARELKLPDKETWFLSLIAQINFFVGNYPKSIESNLTINRLGKTLKRPDISVQGLIWIGNLYRTMGDPHQALRYHFMTKEIQEKLDDKENLLYTLNNIAYEYATLHHFDSTRFYLKKTDSLAYSLSMEELPGGILNDRGDIYVSMGNDEQAMVNYRKSIPMIMRDGDTYNLCIATLGLAKLFYRTGAKDSCLYYIQQTLDVARQNGYLLWEQKASTILVDFYKSTGNIDSALYYSQNATIIKDSIFNLQKLTEFQNISFSEQIREQEVKQEQEKMRSRLSVFILCGCLALFLIVVLFLWRNIVQKQKAKIKIENAYGELKATQSQLIQSEKMASLGELTAGIAHEIQNPLNFVNNFSEVSTELLDEMREELATGNMQQANEIADDVKQNLQKILYHGKQADGIVKGMLQHSRSSNAKKEPTDINKLADEYLRLAFHGLRAKDKDFNATMKTDYDESIGNINIIPQDIGRVLLNLFTNAFYAVSEKKKQQAEGYEPTITLSSKKLNGKVEISVADNGNGIPQKILDKIFQPFFTTKPTGQGTGLGLSLAYDIITAHGGELKVETKEGEGAEFVIQLPVV